MRQNIAALVVLFSFFTIEAHACSCAWEGPFLKVAPKAKHIIVARVLEHTKQSASIYRAMEVEVIESLVGNFKKGRIRIWGDNGMMCRPYISTFPIGTTWVLAIDSPNKGMGDEDGYAISVCGSYWLEVVGDTVRGQISNSAMSDQVEVSTLEDIRNSLKVSKSRSTRNAIKEPIDTNSQDRG